MVRALTFLARRFVAGDTLDEALPVVRDLNRQGLKVSLDHLGEECKTREQAAADRDQYIELIRRLADAKADCNVSLKLTQFGLNLDESLARDNLVKVLVEARRLGNFVRLDMEGSAYTQRTLDLFYSLQGEFPGTGVVIQAMLRRSRADIEELSKRRARVRLCKGAYKEPDTLAFGSKEEVNRNYDELAALLVSGRAPLPGFATHDDGRIRAVQNAAAAAKIPKGAYEFQMLYGLRQRRWKELLGEGHTVRIYVPYGTFWLPYFSRRIRERKENLLFVLKNVFGG